MSAIQGRKSLRNRRRMMYHRMHRFLDACTRYDSVIAAAEAVSISTRQVERWTQRSKAFRARMAKARQEAVARVRGCAYRKAIDEKDTVAIFKILGARDPDFMPKTKEVTVTNRGGVPTSMSVDIENVQISASALTDEEIVTMKRILAKMGAAELTDLFLNPAPEDLMDVPAVPAVEP